MVWCVSSFGDLRAAGGDDGDGDGSGDGDGGGGNDSKVSMLC